MLKIALMVHIMVMPTLMGIFVVGLLAVDQFAGTRSLLGAAAAGIVLSFPLSYLIAKRLVSLTQRSKSA